MNNQEIKISNLQDEIDAWKDASGLDCGGDPDGVTPKHLKKHIDNLDRNVAALEKSSALALQQRDRLFLMIQGMECKNTFWCNIFSFSLESKDCGVCDVCIAKTEQRK